VAGDPAAAADLNTLGDDIAYLYSLVQGTTFSGVQLTRTTDQTLATGAGEYVSWNSQIFDFGGWWSTGTAITVPAGAIPDGFTRIAILVFGRIKFESDDTGARRIQVHVNGTSVGSRTVGSLTGGDPTDIQISEVTTVEAGDIVKLEGYHTAGHNLNLSACDISVLRYAAVD